MTTATSATGYFVQIPGLSADCCVEVDYDGFVSANPASRRTKRFVLQYTHNYSSKGFLPVDDDVVHYLHKSARRSTSRRDYGYFRSKITERIADAKSFATREGAQDYAAKNVTHSILASENGVASSYTVVSAYVPADVASLSPYFGKQKVSA